jgi:hypothetical protein
MAHTVKVAFGILSLLPDSISGDAVCDKFVGCRFGLGVGTWMHTKAERVQKAGNLWEVPDRRDEIRPN